MREGHIERARIFDLLARQQLAYGHQLQPRILPPEREKAEIGVLISLEPATKPMEKEAASAGFYDSPFGVKWGTGLRGISYARLRRNRHG